MSIQKRAVFPPSSALRLANLPTLTSSPLALHYERGFFLGLRVDTPAPAPTAVADADPLNPNFDFHMDASVLDCCGAFALGADLRFDLGALRLVDTAREALDAPAVTPALSRKN